MELHIFIHIADLDCILAALRPVRAEEIILATLDQLRAAVERQNTVVDSAVTLIRGLKAQLDAAATDPAAIAQLSADLDAAAQELADAVQANTPATGEPTA